jgi:PII interaction protein X
MKSVNLPRSATQRAKPSQMTTEAYINHPTFGLLYRVCVLDNGEELFSTLYAQRLFFLVTVGTPEIQFNPVSRADARLLLEGRLRSLRRYGQSEEFQQVQKTYQQTFQ